MMMSSPAEDVLNLMGHELRVVTGARIFPFINFRRDREEPETTVTLLDSIDTRLMHTFAATSNFTFEIREEKDRAWGTETNGVFNGMMGLLQREVKDFCTIMVPTPGRIKVTEYLRSYPTDPLILTSLKPTFLPKPLALIRPFEGEVWLAVVVSVVAWGVILWLLQRAWWWVAGGPGIRFNTAFLYGWGALLERPPSDPSTNTSGQVLVGWWLLFCVIIVAAFRSSLIAHLTVQGRSLPLTSFEDLVNQNNWKWATAPWFLTGAVIDFFTKHIDPSVKRVYVDLELVSAGEALQRVLAGGFSYIIPKSYVTVIVASRYTDKYGQTPFYISNNELVSFADFGWAFRKGAPFYQRFSQMISRLQDAGIIAYWKDEVIARHVMERKEATVLHQVNTLQLLEAMKSLYKGFKACVRVEGEESDWYPVETHTQWPVQPPPISITSRSLTGTEATIEIACFAWPFEEFSNPLILEPASDDPGRAHGAVVPYKDDPFLAG
ncbi:glutamate receptor ionotropic, delta-1-like [Panulirus ornatus]|uniref:glutamate receptor ionotropic, delta-1-like n=1 Tax=Panulirus ornatus TaxID=150431 RepID=UPI003A84B9BC